MKILIVDDDPISLFVLQKIIAGYGNVHIAGDGEAALAEFRKGHAEGAPFDLVCMDIMMPRMDGHTAVKKLREIEEGMKIKEDKRVKILMTSALSSPNTIFESFYDDGATSYLIKPLNHLHVEKTLKAMGFLQEK